MLINIRRRQRWVLSLGGRVLFLNGEEGQFLPPCHRRTARYDMPEPMDQGSLLFRALSFRAGDCACGGRCGA